VDSWYVVYGDGVQFPAADGPYEPDSVLLAKMELARRQQGCVMVVVMPHVAWQALQLGWCGAQVLGGAVLKVRYGKRHGGNALSRRHPRA